MDAAKNFELLIKQLSLTFASRNYLKQAGQTYLLPVPSSAAIDFVLHTVCVFLQLREYFLLRSF